MSAQPTFIDWLFRPFRFVAGSTALIAGLFVISLTAGIGTFSHMHTDGVIDAHFGPGSFLLFLSEGLINLLCMTLTTVIAAKIISKSAFRLIDMIGTQALARAPMILVVVIGLFTPMEAIMVWVKELMANPNTQSSITSGDMTLFIVSAIVSLLAIIWMIALMWQGYKISANTKGATGIISFIIALLAAEVLSKIAIGFLITQLT